MKREDFTNQNEWFNYVHDFRVGDKVDIEATTFSGPSWEVIEKVFFSGDDINNHKILARNGFLRELNIWDIRSICIKK